MPDTTPVTAAPAACVPHDARYDRFTEWVSGGTPTPYAARFSETTDGIERGNRVMHWEAMENDWDPIQRWAAVRWNVADARNRVREEG